MKTLSRGSAGAWAIAGFSLLLSAGCVGGTRREAEAPATSDAPTARSAPVASGTIAPAVPWDAATALDSVATAEACANKLAHGAPFEGCTARLVGNGAAILLQLITECGGDSCSVKSFLWSGDELRGPLPAVEGGGIAFAPDLSFFVTDTRRFLDAADHSQHYYQRSPELVRVSLADGQEQPFAACMSPTLTPDGTHFLCRNRYADLLRVPVEGGALELVAANTFPEPVAWSPYAFTYPGSAEFSDGSTVRVQWGSHEQELPWPLVREPSAATLPAEADGRTPAPCAPPATLEETGARCPPARALSLPAIAADGSRVTALEHWSSCCAEMERLTAVEFSLAEAPLTAPKRTLLWERNEESPGPRLSNRVSRQRVAQLEATLARQGARPLVPLPSQVTRIARDEQLITGGPAVRLLQQGRLVFAAPAAPFEQRGFCCTGEFPPPGEAPTSCEMPAELSESYFDAQTRIVVTVRRHNHQADGCESGPRVELVQLPQGSLPTLAH